MVKYGKILLFNGLWRLCWYMGVVYPRITYTSSETPKATSPPDA